MKFLLLVISLFTLLNVNAQVKDIDGLVKLMAVDVCAELNTKYADKKVSASEMENALMNALLPVLMKHQSALTDLNIEMNDLKAMQKVGESLGIELLVSCPSFRNAMTATMIDENSSVINIPGVAPVEIQVSGENALSVRGKLIKINNEEINSFEIFGADGTTHTFWVLGELRGSQQLYNPAKNDQELEIQYREQMVFDVKSQSSRKVKVAVAIL